MKNMIVFFIMITFLFSLPTFLPNNYSFENYQKVVLVGDEKMGDDCLKCGNDYFCTFIDDGWEKYQSNSSAIIFYFDEFDFSAFSNECDEIYACKNVDEIQVYEGFYKGSQKSVNIDDKKVNFQLAITDNCVILGFPMIVVGF